METVKNLTEAAARDERIALFRNVYLWMTLALVITGATAYAVAGSPALLQALYGSRFALLGMVVVELLLVGWLVTRILRMSFMTATLAFIAYSVLNGATMASIFVLYTASSIASTFFVTAGTFGAMALVGYFTKRDLSRIGSIAFMALVGIIVATLVNLFLRSETLMWVVTYAGVLIFVALTAYDTQKIKRLVVESDITDGDTLQKVALLGSLTLYLDFINLFLYLLRIMGDRR